MKKILFALSLFSAVSTLFQQTCLAQSGPTADNRFRHTVIISFKHDAAPDSIKALDDLYKSLAKSSFVKDFEMGVNVSARDTSVLKHVYVTTFATREDMKSYSKNPDYLKLFKLSLPVADAVTVVDYWIQK